MYRELISPETPQLRVVPVQRASMPISRSPLMTRLRKILASQKLIGLAECICRKMSGVKGKPCHAPLESCLVFGPMAEFYIGNGIAREISMAEAFDVLRKTRKRALSPVRPTRRGLGGMCSCCSCCCEL